MSTVLDPPTNQTMPATNRRIDVGNRLQSVTTAIRLHIRWPGVRKSLSLTQKRLAANAFNADIEVLSAAKKLLDTSHPAFRACSAIKSQAVASWREATLPYVEPGIRLVRRSDLEKLEVKLREAQAELATAVGELDRCYEDLVDQARLRLGELFDSGDYPASISDMFEIGWDYPSTTPPDYLQSVSPDIYHSECQRVRERFNEAVQIAESAFAEELSGMVAHLAERLSGQADGKPKVFRDTAVTNLLEFFDRFQRLNLNSDEQLNQLVSDARSLVSGVVPEQLRQRETLREELASGLARIESSLDGYLSNRPRRNILRRNAS